MGLDLTQDQITRLFAENKEIHEKLDDVRNCIGEIRPDLAVVKSRIETLNTEMYNGMAARLRRTEYVVVSTLAIIALDKGPSILNQAWSGINFILR